MMNMKKVLSRDWNWDRVLGIVMAVISASGILFISWRYGLFGGW